MALKLVDEKLNIYAGEAHDVEADTMMEMIHYFRYFIGNSFMVCYDRRSDIVIVNSKHEKDYVVLGLVRKYLAADSPERKRLQDMAVKSGLGGNTRIYKIMEYAIWHRQRAAVKAREEDLEVKRKARDKYYEQQSEKRFLRWLDDRDENISGSCTEFGHLFKKHEGSMWGMSLDSYYWGYKRGQLAERRKTSQEAGTVIYRSEPGEPLQKTPTTHEDMPAGSGAAVQYGK